MKRNIILIVLLFCLIGANIVCRPGVSTPPSLIPIPGSLIARWTLTDIQSAGTGGPGVWSVANPPGQWMDIQPAGQISGTAFPNATGYQVIDSLTLKVIDPSQSAGFRLFAYHVDTAARALFFYIRPPGGVACIEGCGGYRFGR
ncbi:MAG TPA: hypothetical protein VFE54_12350 [Mucilaginibacter sp.]|jgi:hypothetical protein|nr:hypothetical protein [Mucilaginibacter sp.]